MARTTFGAELKRMMDERGVPVRELTRRLYGEADNRTMVNRWLKIDIHDPQHNYRIEDESLRDIVEALQLNYDDSFYLHGLAGKLPPMRMPRPAQIQRTLTQYEAKLKAHPYPMYVLDVLNFRFWLANAPLIGLIGGLERAHTLAGTSVFQLLFSRQLGVAGQFGDKLATVQEGQVRRYKAMNRFRRHEAFYMEYPERLRDQDGLTAEEYAEFAALWTTVEPAQDETLYSTLAMQVPNSSTVTFELKVEVIFNLKDLFTVTRFDILEPEWREPVRQVFAALYQGDCLRVWEIDGVDTAPIFTDGS
jgi:DNA-dependent RNA polymerase auxiliary subunit epsilon